MQLPLKLKMLQNNHYNPPPYVLKAAILTWQSPIKVELKAGAKSVSTVSFSSALSTDILFCKKKKKLSSDSSFTVKQK